MAPTNVAGDDICKNNKKTQGRRKIEIKKIEKTNSRQVTFSKRRTGLFKKASEICALTGAQISMFVESPGGRLLFAYGHPNADILIDRCRNCVNNKNRDTTTTAGAPLAQSSQPPLPTEEFNQHYVDDCLEWYDGSIEDLNVEELERYLCSLEELEKKATTKADEVALIEKSTTSVGSNEFVMGSDCYVPNMDFISTDAAVYGGFNYQDGGEFLNF